MPNSALPGTAGKAVGLASVEQWLAACGTNQSASDGLNQLYVVSRPDDAFAGLLKASEVNRCTLLSAADAHLGMGHTLAAAVEQIPPGALVIGLADMPWIKPATLRLLADRLTESPPETMLQPSFKGKPGNPLGFGSAHRSALAQCSGDQGARALVRAARASGTVLEIDVDDSGILYDIDQPEDLTGTRFRQQ